MWITGLTTKGRAGIFALNLAAKWTFGTVRKTVRKHEHVQQSGSSRH